MKTFDFMFFISTLSWILCIGMDFKVLQRLGKIV